MNTTTLKTKPLQDFIDDYVKNEPLNLDTVKWAIRKYIYMNYEPTAKTKLEVYEALLHEVAKLLNGNQPQEVQKLLTNIRNWAYARQDSTQEQDAYEQLAIENETFYNLLKRK